MSKLTIGNVTLENNVILAPMAGVTDLPFRLLCKEQGAGLLCMEMVSAKAIYYNNKNTNMLLEIHEEETPVSLQLFGSDPEIISQMAARIEERPFAILDINMGCPVPKVVNNGEGSALMKNPKLAAEIINKTTKAIQKPVTAKIRIGFDSTHINAVEMAKYLEDAGAAAICVHGRTREQYYSGNADWETIARVVDAVSIPVIGNGDIDSPQRAKQMIDETKCAGIMIGRAAQGNPWIFHQVVTYLNSGILETRPDLATLRQTILRHATLQQQYKGDFIGIREMRKHLSWYITGYPNAAKLRGAVNEVESFEDLEKIVQSIIDTPMSNRV